MQLVLSASGSQPRWHMARTRGRKTTQQAHAGEVPECAREGLALNFSD